jgi:hypothetical protein
MIVMFLINVCLMDELGFSSKIPAVVRSIPIAGFFGFLIAFSERNSAVLTIAAAAFVLAVLAKAGFQRNIHFV